MTQVSHQPMGRGFYTIMAAQFFSSLADNALLVAAIELLKASHAPTWHVAALAPMFALFYVVLAPFVGALADAYPKGQVMFVSNFIKVIGCMMMLFGGHPLLAYAIVGLGAAAYSPAKYGILTELLPPSLLVKANGWIEGLTVASIILGILLGGYLISSHASSFLLSFDLPFIQTGIDTPPETAIAVMILIYTVAAWFNTCIPRTGAQMILVPKKIMALLPDFWQCNTRLWNDKLGQITLSTTTLFWGVLGNLRVIVFAWAAAALGYTTSQASTLVGVIVIGTAIGAVVASMRMTLDRATSLIPLGIAMGILMFGLNFITGITIAIPFLILLGGLAGFLVVPMNALLQHRGHNLMGAGRSIAVQNFNEQACILGLGLLYTLGTRLGMTAFGAIAFFGFSIAGVMWLIMQKHKNNCRKYPEEVTKLIEHTRHDHSHH